MPVPRAVRVVLVAVCVMTAITTSFAQTDVNGSWTAWSELSSTCTKTCANGTLMRLRTCTDPSPQGSGLRCTKTDGTVDSIEMKEFPCNTQQCWTGDWGNWSACSVNCSIGTQARQAMCGNEVCIDPQAQTQTQECNTWNITTCPDPCDAVRCPKFALCENLSTVEKPITRCLCTMGMVMQGGKCVPAPPTTPTPRPIPTLPPVQKIVATVLTKTASTVLIVCVSITLILFIIMRVFTPDRVIQMNMEIALLTAHLFLMFPDSITDTPNLCRFVSIILHFLFTACFMFMMLEALHMYSLVAYVVKSDGMFTRLQNVALGWGTAMFIVLYSMCFEFDNYGDVYQCWLKMDTGVNYASVLPICILMIITFTLTEAAGAAEYKQLPDLDREQLTSAKFSQRTNLFIMPAVFASWLLGVLSYYQQDLAIYSLFSISNAVLGVLVMILHCSNNTEVRAKAVSIIGNVTGKSDKPKVPGKPTMKPKPAKPPIRPKPKAPVASKPQTSKFSLPKPKFFSK